MPAPSLVSEEEFANLALGHLGEPSIASFDDDHPSARACRRFFAIARDATLRAPGAWWNFATAYAIPPATTDSLGPLSKRFVLPADCVAVREVRPDRTADPINNDDWEVETSVIVDGAGAEIETMLLSCLDLTACHVHYTRRVTAPRLWTPDFGLAFSHKLAALVAPDVARDAAAAKHQEGLFEQALPEVKRADAREKARSRASKNLTSWAAARR